VPASGSSTRLRILVVEDQEDDYRLLIREVERAGYSVVARQVETESALITALSDERWDLVVADYTLPRITAERALAVVKQRAPELPFIIASGSVGEENAVAVMKAGANDFVLKSGLSRLVPAIERELGDARIRADRTRLREQLMVSDRLASIGTLAAGIAHEINNPLAVALGNVEYALSSVVALERGGPTAIGPELREPLVDAKEALGRVRDIVRDVKLFSRAGDPTRRGPVDLRQVLRSALRMTWNEARHRARLVEEFGQLPVIDGNDSRLGQVFLNLLVNAIQSLPDGHATQHRITVRTRTDEQGAAVVEIEDTGCGIAPEHLPRVFEPFFTTKQAESATGLGLAICHAIVAETGGTISVSSEVQKGTLVRVTLPRGVEPEPAAKQRAISEGVGVRGQILVVDDEPMLGVVIKRALEPDHHVTAVSSSREALAAMADQEFDVILCDLMMPDIDGIALYWMIDPSKRAKVVFVTGGAFSPDVRAFLEDLPNRRLDKPFEPENLRGLIRELMRDAARG
jgi:signal transduction histidine kinase